MKQVCIHCTRQGPIKSLWCQEVSCGTDDKPTMLEPGDLLGEIEIIRTVAVLRTVGLYAVSQGGRKVLLKVAHDGMQQRLKRESEFLCELQARKRRHPSLPILLPAYGKAGRDSYPYGKAVTGGQTFYFSLYHFTNGELLRDILLRNPQPWYQQAGLLFIAVADAVALMHSAQRLHLCLSPESILIRYDLEGYPRPVLIDLGAVTPIGEVNQNWCPSFVHPAYLAPELAGTPGSKVGAFTDVYGLGLLLTEMLAGRPAFAHRLRGEAEVIEDVLYRPPAVPERPDLKYLPQIAERAVSKDFRRRQPYVLELAKELEPFIPLLPNEKQKFQVNWHAVAVIVSAALVISFLLVFALSLGSGMG